MKGKVGLQSTLKNFNSFLNDWLPIFDPALLSGSKYNSNFQPALLLHPACLIIS